MADAGYDRPPAKPGQFVADKKPRPKGDGSKQPKDKNKNEIPDFYEARLDELGLRVTKEGRIVAENPRSQPTVEQLRVIQQGFNRFGLTNDFFDPNRMAFGGEMAQTAVGKAPVYYDLATGTTSSGGGVADDDLLARLREKTGWTPEQAYAYLQENDLLKDVGLAGSTFEGWMGYTARARQNYLNPPLPQKTALGQQGHSFLGGFDVMNEEDVASLGGVVSDFFRARQQKLAPQQPAPEQPVNPISIEDLAEMEE